MRKCGCGWPLDARGRCTACEKAADRRRRGKCIDCGEDREAGSYCKKCLKEWAEMADLIKKPGQGQAVLLVETAAQGRGKQEAVEICTKAVGNREGRHLVEPRGSTWWVYKVVVDA